MYLCVDIYTRVQVLMKAGDFRFLGSRVIGGCDPTSVGTENQIQVLYISNINLTTELCLQAPPSLVFVCMRTCLRDFMSHLCE